MPIALITNDLIKRKMTYQGPFQREWRSVVMLGLAILLVSSSTLLQAAEGFCDKQRSETVLFCQDFNGSTLGLYNDEALQKDWPGLSYLSNKHGIRHLGIEQQRVSIVDNNIVQPSADVGNINRSLKVHYPAGRFGPLESGATWIVRFPQRYAELTLEYKVRFGDGFLFDRDKLIGGKLPGLMGGKSISGNADADGQNGWTARFMWGQKGRGLAYLYYPDMRDSQQNRDACPRFGHGTEKCSIYRNKYFTTDSSRSGKCLSEWPLESDAFYFQANRFYTIRQRIRLNSLEPGIGRYLSRREGKRDGIIQVWVDNKLMIDCNNIRYRDIARLGIDGLLFNTFFGGNTAESSAHPTDETILFDDILVTAPVTKPIGALDTNLTTDSVVLKSPSF